jgi:ornithine cyclodeaminase/alanine dehydrogenase-like protein (mu-crystallin family)
VRDSDLVSFCTSTVIGNPDAYPCVQRAWVKPGAFLAMPAACSLDAGMEAPGLRKVLDNTGLYEAWYHEVPKPAHHVIPLVGVRFMDMLAEGRMSKDELEDLGKIVAGAAPGRRNDEEIIIMSVGGMPVEDVAWGTVIYRRALAEGIGVKLNLWDVPVLR